MRSLDGSDVTQELTAIFQDENGKMPDLQALAPRNPRRLGFILGGAAAFILLLVAASWMGFLFFKPYRGFQGQGLQIVILGPERVILGAESTYFVNWQNAASEPLARADIRVSFPSDFTPTSILPKPTGDGFTWKLGTIGFGGRGTFTIKGIFSGALGTKTAIQAVGSYRPASFNSEFEALTTQALEYAETVVDGQVFVAEKILPGDKIRIEYAFKNRGTVPLPGLEARLTLPPGFVRDQAASHTALDERVVRLSIGNFAAGASTTFAISGTFSSGHAGEATVHAELGKIGADGSFQAVHKTDETFLVLSGDLVLKLVTNGSDANQTIAMGNTLHLAVGYENTATEPVQDVSIKVRFEPPIFLDWAHAENTASGTVSGNSITWNKKQIGVLERVPPGQEGTIEFSIPVLNNATGTSAFQVVTEATMKSVGETIVNRTIKSTPITFRFRTDADLTNHARYFSEEGAPLGMGPLPPVVGQTTRYRIEWNLAKTSHELKNLAVTAMLPKRVAWTAKSVVGAGELRYDATTRGVTWSLNRVPGDVKDVSASFDVDLTPGELDAGRFADLLGETRVEFTDADVNEIVSRTKPPLTTDLQNDEVAKSKGVVRKP